MSQSQTPEPAGATAGGHARGRGMRGAALAIAVFACAAAWAAPAPARADSDFEDAFERQLGRLAANHLVYAGKAALTHGTYGYRYAPPRHVRHYRAPRRVVIEHRVARRHRHHDDCHHGVRGRVGFRKRWIHDRRGNHAHRRGVERRIVYRY